MTIFYNSKQNRFYEKYLNENVNDNVKNCVDSNNLNSYHNLKKIFKNLKLFYEKKIDQIQIKFKNFDFRINVLNKIEIFEQFVIYYNVVIVSLNFNDDQKIR